MAKVIEKRTIHEIKVGDLVVVNTHTGNDPICIVVRMLESFNDKTRYTVYECVNLATGDDTTYKEDYVTKYHGTITLSNE